MYTICVCECVCVGDATAFLREAWHAAAGAPIWFDFVSFSINFSYFYFLVIREFPEFCFINDKRLKNWILSTYINVSLNICKSLRFSIYILYTCICMCVYVLYWYLKQLNSCLCFVISICIFGIFFRYHFHLVFSFFVLFSAVLLSLCLSLLLSLGKVF